MLFDMSLLHLCNLFTFSCAPFWRVHFPLLAPADERLARLSNLPLLPPFCEKLDWKQTIHFFSITSFMLFHFVMFFFLSRGLNSQTHSLNVLGFFLRFFFFFFLLACFVILLAGDKQEVTHTHSQPYRSPWNATPNRLYLTQKFCRLLKNKSTSLQILSPINSSFPLARSCRRRLFYIQIMYGDDAFIVFPLFFLLYLNELRSYQQ